MGVIQKAILKNKQLSEWSEEEREAAKDLTHSVQLSYHTARELAATGSKTQTWEELVRSLLEAQKPPSADEVSQGVQREHSLLCKHCQTDWPKGKLVHVETDYHCPDCGNTVEVEGAQ